MQGDYTSIIRGRKPSALERTSSTKTHKKISRQILASPKCLPLLTIQGGVIMKRLGAKVEYCSRCGRFLVHGKWDWIDPTKKRNLIASKMIEYTKCDGCSAVKRVRALTR